MYDLLNKTGRFTHTNSMTKQNLFGEIAMNLDYLKSLDLAEGLSRQLYDMEGMKIGEILVELNVLNQNQVNEIRTIQKIRDWAGDFSF